MTPKHVVKGLLSILVFTFLASSWYGAASGPTCLSAVEAGRMIYEQGLLSGGLLLRGKRSGGLESIGPEAACIHCHQKSGMGLAEGGIYIPPVSSRSLFRNEQPILQGDASRLAPGMRFEDPRARPPYDDITLSNAIRFGRTPTGRVLDYVMPRYDLSDDATQALIAYLHTLSDQPSPGATNEGADFATVVAPDADPAQEDAFLGVLRACFKDMSGSEKASSLNVNEWRLHVWKLKGGPETWDDQLRDEYERQPVFALVSGLGKEKWGPVDRFCEARQLPCLFPNVEKPGSATGGRYNFYFSRGIMLEADVAASYLRDAISRKQISRIVQISQSGDAGAEAAAELRDRLATTGIAIEDRILQAADRKPSSIIAGVTSTDALVVWLRGPDISALTEAVPPPSAHVILFSALLGWKDKPPLSTSWKQSSFIIYPFDPPFSWERRVAYNLRPWLSSHSLLRRDERIQGNTLAACSLLSEGMSRLRGHYLREYLVEVIENYPTMGNAPASAAFPRFSIGPGQRFTSKGAYIARYSQSDPSRLEQVEDWIVP